MRVEEGEDGNEAKVMTFVIIGVHVLNVVHLGHASLVGGVFFAHWWILHMYRVEDIPVG